MYDDYDDDSGDFVRRTVKGGVALIAIVLTAMAGMWVLREPSQSAVRAAAEGESTTTTEPVAAPDVTTETSVAPVSSTSVPSDDPDPAPSTTFESAPIEPVEALDGPDAVGPATTEVPIPTEAPPASTAPSVPPTSAAPAAANLPYPAAADGTPLPVQVVYDENTVTISGAVPDEASRARIEVLAAANAQTPDPIVDNQLLVNEHVPISVGVRVIELQSPRFPEGEDDITAEHAAQFDRVASVLAALPNVTAVVVGHADQRGDDATNLALSDQRARSVVNYLTYLGVAPTRLASRAAGESDLLTLADDDTSLALNRRTEFIFYGVLVV